ncbi:hypothetical protein KEM09_21505 [Carboxylicivirga mesophila]|uniref:DUF5658 domain-containing protein n=1 Tax=Carboxylicivirga mesophila TaxID=1166478 RepID=A0ABS5KGF1_9BACT|nr:hypothetical protein [Carboxylicivirga mesophila]MBS2214000.1 hypothetical protein [Carboxylicivirga mesophila]
MNFPQFKKHLTIWFILLITLIIIDLVFGNAQSRLAGRAPELVTISDVFSNVHIYIGRAFVFTFVIAGATYLTDKR